jgi:dUTP pyrophosphatase
VQTVPIKLRKLHQRAVIPRYQHAGDAGFDLCLASDESVVLEPGMRRLLPTGLAMEIAPGFEVQVRSRSGWAVREGLTVLNSPGTIDSSYRGEVQICLMNHGYAPVTLQPGERIAQGVVAPVWHAVFEVADELSETGRGAGGFGSTGT